MGKSNSYLYNLVSTNQPAQKHPEKIQTQCSVSEGELDYSTDDENISMSPLPESTGCIQTSTSDTLHQLSKTAKSPKQSITSTKILQVPVCVLTLPKYHKPIHTHLLGHACNLLQVAGGSSGDLSIAKDDLLCCSTSQGPHNPGKNLGLGDQAGILPRGEPGQTARLATGDDGHLLDRVVARGQGSAWNKPFWSTKYLGPRCWGENRSERQRNFPEG
jgi:hypothetical protein